MSKLEAHQEVATVVYSKHCIGEDLRVSEDQTPDRHTLAIVFHYLTQLRRKSCTASSSLQLIISCCCCSCWCVGNVIYYLFYYTFFSILFHIVWKHFHKINLFEDKLDVVGTVDNRPSTNKLHHFIQKKWHVTHDMWHLTSDTWKGWLTYSLTEYITSLLMRRTNVP